MRGFRSNLAGAASHSAGRHLDSVASRVNRRSRMSPCSGENLFRSIVCSEQTIVCGRQTIVYPRQTMVCSHQTKRIADPRRHNHLDRRKRKEHRVLTIPPKQPLQGAYYETARPSCKDLKRGIALNKTAPKRPEAKQSNKNTYDLLNKTLPGDLFD